MKNLNFINKIVALIFLICSGCVSKPFKLVSEPDNAEAFLLVGEEKEKKSLGQTPVIKTKKEIEELIDADLNSGSTLNIVFQKDGYADKELWIPASAGGNLGVDIEVTLTKGLSSKDEVKTANQIIEKLFLAQNLARTQQFERAVIEIDKLIEKFPTLVRAMTMKGAILYASNSLKESLGSYEKALSLNPDLKTALEMSSKIRKQLKLPQRSVAKVK